MSTFRHPLGQSGRSSAETAQSALRHELMEEQAQSLGRAGRKVEAALAALQAHPGGEGRPAALAAAADAVWCYFVQRDVMGLRNRDEVVAQYGIPREVLVRLGAR